MFNIKHKLRDSVNNIIGNINNNNIINNNKLYKIDK
jgi:hypothetical protein